jgi:hypothetical protein
MSSSPGKAMALRGEVWAQYLNVSLVAGVPLLRMLIWINAQLEKML